MMSHALEQIHAAGIIVISKSASIACHFLLSRLQGHSFQFVFQKIFPAYTLKLPSVCVLPTAFKTFRWNKLGILTGTSWHFFNISSDISTLWAHESTSLDINKAKGMLTSNAKRIFCDNVTCFGTNKCCCDRSHLQRVLQLLLTACLQVYSFQFVFQLVFPAYIFQLPSICVLRTAFKKSCLNKRGILPGTSWHFSHISSDISAPWAHESTSLDIKKAKGMLTSNARRIFCGNVTCLGTNECCSNRSHLQRVLQLLLTACLQVYSFQFVFHQLVFPAYTLQLPSTCVLPAAFKTLCLTEQGILLGTSWHFSNISSDISAPWAHESTYLISIRPKEC